MMFCKRCKKDVITFKQQYSTVPQTVKNEVRHYRDVFCALCGYCIETKITDEIPKESK